MFDFLFSAGESSMGFLQGAVFLAFTAVLFTSLRRFCLQILYVMDSKARVRWLSNKFYFEAAMYRTAIGMADSAHRDGLLSFQSVARRMVIWTAVCLLVAVTMPKLLVFITISHVVLTETGIVLALWPLYDFGVKYTSRHR